MHGEKPIRPAWAEINLENLDYNLQSIRKKLGTTGIMGIVKADAYGHGAVAVARRLAQNGVTSFGVATLNEALELRRANTDCEICILGIIPSGSAALAVDNDIDTVVCDKSYAEALSEAASAAGKTAGIYIIADTGMGRIGYLTHDAAAIEKSAMAAKALSTLPSIKVKGVFSHFATADEADKRYSETQYDRFNKFCQALTTEDVDIPARLMANSASVMELAAAHYEIARPGIILYGIYPSSEVDKSKLSLRPVMSVKARIAHIKRVPAGASISYGRRYTAEEERVIATLPIGYADGYPRLYSSQAKVIVRGSFAPVRGSICMDQCMIDVTDIPGVKEADEAIILGSDGKLEITAAEIAQSIGTIAYEIVCGFGRRLEKIYTK